MIDVFDLREKCALVTGASRGIGRGIAVEFARRGAVVVGLGRDEQALAETMEEMSRRGGAGSTLAADLGDEAATTEAFAEAVQRLGGIDILVNNAGVDHQRTALDSTAEEWDRVQKVNLRSAFLLCQAAGRVMTDQGWGKVINIGSIGSHVAWPADISYLASKHALLGLTRGLALEWARSNVQVNLLSPGYVDTEMNRAVVSDDVRSRSVIDRTPLGRWGVVDDMVGGAVFLASRASDFMTGQSLVIDGGWTIQ